MPKDHDHGHPASAPGADRSVTVRVEVSETFGAVALFVVALCLIWLLSKQMERNRA